MSSEELNISPTERADKKNTVFYEPAGRRNRPRDGQYSLEDRGIDPKQAAEINQPPEELIAEA